jgi:uncharacterized repeat protein (TIGR01451 family)
MSRRFGVLAVLVAGLGLATAPSALAASSDLTVAVSGSPDPVAAGQYVSYEVSVTNNGPNPAANVVVTAPLPAQTQYVQNSSLCSFAAGTITCNLGTVPSTGNVVFETVLRLTNFSFHGFFNHTYTVTSTSSDPNPGNNSGSDLEHVLSNSHDHHITPLEVQKQYSLQPGQYTTQTLTCPNGGSAVDGSFGVDNVDQDTGTLRSVGIFESKSVGNDWEFTAQNFSNGQAQGKMFAVCIPKSTAPDTQQHDITFEPLKTLSVLVPAGHSDIVLPCGAPSGTFVSPAAPGFEFTGGAAGDLVRSEEDISSGPGWSWGFEMSAPGTITVSLRCLDRYVSAVGGHTHELWLSHPDKWVTVPPNAPAGGQYDIDCSDEAKGIIATYDLPYGVWSIGNQPQIKRRSFKLLNETGVNQQVHLDLICLGDRTGTDPPPPAAPNAVQPTTTPVKGASALPVGVVCPSGGCSGSVTLLASGPGTRAVIAKAKVIGTATFASHASGIRKVKVAIAKRYRSAIKSGKIRKVSAVIRGYDGKVAKRLTIRIKR